MGAGGGMHSDGGLDRRWWKGATAGCGATAAGCVGWARWGSGAVPAGGERTLKGRPVPERQARYLFVWATGSVFVVPAGAVLVNVFHMERGRWPSDTCTPRLLQLECRRPTEPQTPAVHATISPRFPYQPRRPASSWTAPAADRPPGALQRPRCPLTYSRAGSQLVAALPDEVGAAVPPRLPRRPPRSGRRPPVGSASSSRGPAHSAGP